MNETKEDQKDWRKDANLLIGRQQATAMVESPMMNMQRSRTFLRPRVLERWVEAGVRPDQVLGTNPASGKSRPICAYPKMAKLRWGSLDDPAAFVCE